MVTELLDIIPLSLGLWLPSTSSVFIFISSPCRLAPVNLQFPSISTKAITCYTPRQWGWHCSPGSCEIEILEMAHHSTMLHLLALAGRPMQPRAHPRNLWHRFGHPSEKNLCPSCTIKEAKGLGATSKRLLSEIPRVNKLCLTTSRIEGSKTLSWTGLDCLHWRHSPVSTLFFSITPSLHHHVFVGVEPYHQRGQKLRFEDQNHSKQCLESWRIAYNHIKHSRNSLTSN